MVEWSFSVSSHVSPLIGHSFQSDIGHSLLEEFLIDFLDFECFFNPASDVVPNHKTCQFLPVHENDSLAQRSGSFPSGGRIGRCCDEKPLGRLESV